MRQVCLAVMGSGRTAMFFVSNGTGAAEIRGNRGRGGLGGGDERALRERTALIDEACRFIGQPGPEVGGGVRLAQALLEPEERDAITALTGAGFTRIGDLAYLRRPLAPPAARWDARLGWPAGIAVRRVADLDPAEATPALLAALDRSYVETLDCPELCGLRETADVLESHRAVGRHDPELWWVVYADARPEGCVLISPCPEQGSVELVYLGLSPALRGRGLGSALLTMGLAAVAGRPGESLTCAVDTRNAPAMRLYRRGGFERFATRVPLVKRLQGEGGGIATGSDACAQRRSPHPS